MSEVSPGRCGSVGWSVVPYTERSQVLFLVITQPGLWVRHIQDVSLALMFFSLFLSLPSPLSQINKHVLR